MLYTTRSFFKIAFDSWWNILDGNSQLSESSNISVFLSFPSLFPIFTHCRAPWRRGRGIFLDFLLFFLKQEPSEKKAPLDMSLFLKLQKRVTELEQEKQSLQDELDRKEEQALRAKAKVDSF